MTQPTALYLADVLANDPCSKSHHDEAAAELRRLYMVDKLYQAALAGRNVMHLELHKANAERGTLQAQRDALLEALKAAEPYLRHADVAYNVYVQARAAIAKAEGEHMTTQPEALRLADALRDSVETDGEWSQEQVVAAAAELRRLSEIETLYLAAMRGRHAMSEELLALTTQRDALLEALKGITPPMPTADAPCHVGLVPQEKCAHCGRIARARAAIKQAEGEKT